MIVKAPVQTEWKGMVAIGDRYVKKMQPGDTLVLEHKNETMTIPGDMIIKKTAFVSKKTFADKYGREPYKLVYFYWKSDTERAKASKDGKQGELF